MKKGESKQRVIGEAQHQVIQLPQPTDHGIYTFRIEPPFKKRPVVLVIPNAGGLNAVVELIMEKGFFTGFQFSNKTLTKEDESKIVTTYKPFTFVIIADEAK